MLSNKVAYGLIALVGMVGAAGAGAYLASRQTPAPDKPAAAVTTPSTTPGPGGAVEATEAVMDDSASTSAHESASATVDKSAPGSAAAPGSGSATADKPAARPKPRAADRPVASQQQKPSAVPATSQPTRDQHAATGTDIQTPRTEPSPSPADAHPVDADRASRVEGVASEPAAPVFPPAPQYLEVTVPAESVIGLQIETALSSETARVEDRVSARVTRDVRADGRVAIPAGSRVLGSVSIVDRGGRVKEQARLGVRFHTVILADGTELPLQTETIIREGESPANSSAAKIGGAAIGGAILGAILGGGKGAAIGGAVGGAGGTTAVMTSDRRPAKIAAGSPVTVKVLSPVTVTVEKE